MERDAFDVGQRRGDLDDLAVRDGAVGLEDDLAAAFADPVANELPRLFDRRGGTFAVAQEEPGLGASGRGLEQGQERRGRLLDADAVPRGGMSTFSPPVKCIEKSMNVMS